MKTESYTADQVVLPGRTSHARTVPSSQAITTGEQRSRAALWTGRFLSGFAALFMLFDASIKVLRLPVAMEGTTQLGYPVSVIFWLGLVQLVCLAVYLFPRTAVLGAVLWTGYLGGAIATHVRVGNPLFSHVLFPTYVAAFFWLGLWLRDERLRAILPFYTKR